MDKLKNDKKKKTNTISSSQMSYSCIQQIFPWVPTLCQPLLYTVRMQQWPDNAKAREKLISRKDNGLKPIIWPYH